MEKKDEKVEEQKLKKGLMEENEKQNPSKKTNRTWEAFGKSKGCFIINDPKFLL